LARSDLPTRSSNAVSGSSGGALISDAPVPKGLRSVALWLGTPDRPLLCWLDLPDDGLVAGAAVLCPTMGLEAEYSVRAVRDLAHRLAAAGWAAVRLDYAASGDSAGTWTDPDLVQDWLGNVRTAIEYARGLGAPRLAVVGLRIGATLAAAEVARGEGVDDLVLWDPCATGRAFLREQRAFWAFLRDQAVDWGTLRAGEVWGSGGDAGDGSVEGPGVLFSAATVSDLEPLAIDPGAATATRELLLFRQGRKPPRALAARLALSHVESEEVVGQDALLDVSAVTPDRALDRMVAWLTEAGGPPVRVEPPEPGTAEVQRSADGAAVLERPLEIGPARLFGILSEPEGGVAQSAPTVIFLNAGRIGHHGPARLWVDLARSWAAEGIRSLRVDLSGIGDSPTRPGRTEQVEFPADALEDLADIRRAMGVETGTDLFFVGLCSGGYHAIESALESPVAALFLVNPAITYYRVGDPPPRRFEPDATPGFDDRQGWGANRQVLSRVMGRLGPLADAARWIPGVWWVHKQLFVTMSPARMFERLERSGVDVLVVLGTVEAEELCRGEYRRLGALVRKGGLTMETMPSLEHSLFERTGRDRVAELLKTHVRGLVARSAGAVGPGAEP
jgi:dienelactone hydrolase